MNPVDSEDILVNRMPLQMPHGGAGGHGAQGTAHPIVARSKKIARPFRPEVFFRSEDDTCHANGETLTHVVGSLSSPRRS